MPRIRVLEVGKSTAGIGAYLRYLARGLNMEKFQLTFVCLSDGGAELAQELRGVADVQAMSWRMNRFKIDVFGDLLIAFQLAQIIHSRKFDLVHAHGSKAGFLARVAAIGSGVPVIYSPHCFSFHDGAGKLQAKFFAALERFAARFFTAKIIVVADGEQTLARRYRVGSPNQFATVRNGINAAYYQIPVNRRAVKKSLGIPEDAPLIGSVGRLGKQKSPLTFIRAAAIVREQAPRAQFIWVGSGPLYEESIRLTKELGLQDAMRFAGERKDVPSILQTLDCFVLSSLWEGFSIVLLEAMAAGAPIVATNILGNDEAIADGENGWLVPPDDPQALARKILELLENFEQAKKFGNAARERIQKDFTFAQMIRSIENVYLSLPFR